MSEQDELLAQKMEDQQAQQTMQHLIESERTQQRKMFEQERESTHALLTSVRNKLHSEQDRIVKQVQDESNAAVHKVETQLEQTSMARTIEDIVKKKLSKRLNELKAAGKNTIHDVSSQLDALKHRVRRLRRQQRRFQMTESSLEQKMEENQSHERRDLGESSSIGNSMAAEMQKLRLERMMQSFEPSRESAEHQELLKMKDEMAELRAQNSLLQQQVSNHMSVQLTRARRPKYSHEHLHRFFQNQRQKHVAILKNSVMREQQKLHELTAQLKDEESEQSPSDTEMLVQLSEGSNSLDSETSLPLYHQHAEQARVESEDLRQRALEAAIGSQHFGE